MANETNIPENSKLGKAEARLKALLNAASGQCELEAAFPCGHGSTGRHTKPRNRSIDSSVKRASKIEQLASEVEVWRKSVSQLPRLREFAETFDRVLTSGMIKGAPLSRADRKYLVARQALNARAILRAETLIAA